MKLHIRNIGLISKTAKSPASLNFVLINDPGLCVFLGLRVKTSSIYAQNSQVSCAY